MNLRKFKYALLLAPTMLVAACGGGGDAEDRLDVADPRVRFIQAIPVGTYTLFRNDMAQSDATNVGYKYGSKYFDVETGQATWAVKTDSGTTIVEAPIDARRGNRYTLIAAPAANDGQSFLTIRDPYNKGLVSDKARVRIANAAFTVGSIDLYITPVGTSIDSLQPTMAAVEYGAASPADSVDSIELAGGSYQLQMTEAGTKDVVFNTTVTIDNNADWLFVAVPDGLSAKLLVSKADDNQSGTLTEPTPQ